MYNTTQPDATLHLCCQADKIMHDLGSKVNQHQYSRMSPLKKTTRKQSVSLLLRENTKKGSRDGARNPARARTQSRTPHLRQRGECGADPGGHHRPQEAIGHDAHATVLLNPPALRPRAEEALVRLIQRVGFHELRGQGTKPFQNDVLRRNRDHINNRHTAIHRAAAAARRGAVWKQKGYYSIRFNPMPFMVGSV